MDMESKYSSDELMLRLKKSLVTLKNQSRLIEKYKEPIAIVGMSCRFPGGADNIDFYWNLLCEGKDLTSEIPVSRWNVEDYYDPNPEAKGKIITRRAGFLTTDLSKFDPEFFGISPREAELMDPQQRLLLEVMTEALENAGIASDDISGSLVSVFTGICSHDFSDLLDIPDAASLYSFTGGTLSIASGRLSFVFDLQGPNQAIDTACSSSLVAVHEACQSLHTGEADLAIAGGVNLILSPNLYILLSKSSMLSPDGYCKTFDESADGMGRAEGCGLVVLKRLSDAERDKDNIIAVIEASGINHDGFSSGLTAPNGRSQQELAKHVCKEANINPSDIDYVEAHGTGTGLGDPIEVRAIGAVYGQREEKYPLMLGSVKSNMGHAEGAAGIASLIKAALTLQHEKIPPNLHFNKLNPHINLNFPAEIITECKEWKRNKRARRVAINSFGFSGTNALVILREAPLNNLKKNADSSERPLHILTISGKSELALNALVASYLLFFEKTDASLADIAYTANTGRNHERYRIAVIAKDLAELKMKLNKAEYLRGEAQGRSTYDFNFTGDWAKDLEDLAIAYTKGALVDWRKFDKPYERQKIVLPTYPFQRSRYWPDALIQLRGKKSASVHPLLGEMQAKPNGEIDFFSQLYLSNVSYLKDHMVYEYVVFPGAGYIEMMLSAARYGLGSDQIELNHVAFEVALSFDKGKGVEAQVIMTPIAEAKYEVVIYSKIDTGGFSSHARAIVGLRGPQQSVPSAIDIQAIKSRCQPPIITDNFYSAFWDSGLHLGKAFRTLQTISMGDGEAFGEVVLGGLVNGYLAHPALLDGCLQISAIFSLGRQNTELQLPIGIDSFTLYAQLEESVVVFCDQVERNDNGTTINLVICNLSGKVLASVKGFRLRKTTEQALKKMLSHDELSARFLYEWSWQEHAFEDVSGLEALGHWLILSDGELTTSIKDVFEARGASCKCIAVNELPKSKEEFLVLLKEEIYAGILHVASTASSDLLTLNNIKKAQVLGSESFLHLTQAVVELQKNTLLFLITKNITSDNVPQSPLSGLYKTILAEEPALQMKWVDLGSNWDAALVEKVLFNKENESIVVIKEAHSYVPRFIEIPSLEKDNLIEMRCDASYLITGGLGGLGQALAKWLIEKGATHIILTGRRVFDDEIKEKLKIIETPNTTISYQSIDIGDEKSVENLLIQLQQNKKPLKGIFHLAGILDDAMLLDQDWNHFESVFRPKVYGSFYLHHYSKNLDLFVVFSSIASSLGNPGQSNYAAANAFMDALCEHRKLQGLPAHSLSWGPWAEVGMAKELVAKDSKGGLLGLKPEEAMRALESALLLGKTQITIANINWKNYLGPMREAPMWLRAFAQDKISHEYLSAQLEHVPVNERPALIKSFVSQAVRSVLGFSTSQTIDEEQSFFELGLDSLMTLELKNFIQAALGNTILISPTAVFDYDTIKKMGGYIEQLGVTSGLPFEKISTSNHEYFELSSAQRRMWFMYELKPSDNSYNISLAVRIQGKISLTLMQKAFDAVIERHAILRTVYAYRDNQVVQIIQEPHSIKFNHMDWRNYSDQVQQEKLTQLERPGEPFNLESGPVIRATLISLSGEEQAALYLEIHHIASDATSIITVFDDLMYYYEKLISNSSHKLPQLELEYVDCAQWFSKERESAEYQIAFKYWKERLQDVPRIIQLPTDYPRQQVNSYEGAVYHFEIDPNLRRKIENLAETHQSTPFVALLTIYAILLHKYSRDQEVNIGIMFSRRPLKEMERLVGFFINTLIATPKFHEDKSFSAMLAQTKQMIRDLFSHQAVPFEEMVDSLNLERNLSVHPLFQVSFNYVPAIFKGNKTAHLNMEFLGANTGYPEFDLALEMFEGETTYTSALKYNAKIFRKETIARIINHFINLLEQISANPTLKLSEISLLTPSERTLMLETWADTSKHYPLEKRMVDFFEEQAGLTPERVAVIYDDIQLNYGELNSRANQLARYLQTLGAKPDQLIGVCLPRSVEMLVATLAIMKSGAAYVPLDPSFPAHRLEYMVEDSELSILITIKSLLDRFPKYSGKMVLLDQEKFDHHESLNLEKTCGSEHLAYVIYTSGSTGKPKGVQIEHRSLTNFLLSMLEQPGMSKEDVLLAVTTVSFDIAALELYLPLMIGARVVIAREEAKQNIIELQELIFKHQVTVMQATPTTWMMLFESGWSGNKSLTVLCGGEPLKEDLSQKIRQLCKALWNMYGPTETTIWSSLAKMSEGDRITIGRPIANTTFYILDNYGHPLPIGVPGELYIGGAGVARGYLKRLDLTAEKFVSDPFSEDSSARMYNTGDLARYLRDGRVECLGRSDYQVKIRGYRLELGDIEAKLSHLPQIQEGVVIVREDMDTSGKSDKRLVAYIIPKEKMPLNDSEKQTILVDAIKKDLKKELPDYMIPAHFVLMADFPLTPNRKIDRKKLPRPEVVELFPELLSQANATEKQILEIWQKIIGVSSIRLNENFFDCGGNSLLALSVYNQINAIFPERITLLDLFTYPTIALLAVHIEGKLDLSHEPAGSTKSIECENKVSADEIRKMSDEEMIRLLKEGDDTHE
jgi:amino acid adenylation domain-containing protein